MSGTNGHADQAEQAMYFAQVLDSKRVAGGSVVLSQAVAAAIQLALEDGASAHKTLADTP